MLSQRNKRTEIGLPGVRGRSANGQQLEMPQRPTLTIGGKEPYRGHGPFHGFDASAPRIFRLTWTLPLQSSLRHADIQRYEIFACIQRSSGARSAEISRWRKIAEIPNPKESSARNGKRVTSRRMAGFDPGFRYQLAVRGVDIFEREGPFSQPVSVVV